MVQPPNRHSRPHEGISRGSLPRDKETSKADNNKPGIGGGEGMDRGNYSNATMAPCRRRGDCWRYDRYNWFCSLSLRSDCYPFRSTPLPQGAELRCDPTQAQWA